MPWHLFRSSLVGRTAPDISGDVWFNAENLPLAAKEAIDQGRPIRIRRDLVGQVVLVDFWDYSCINCIRTLPYLTEWWKLYKDFNFLIIGVHTPEFEFGKDPDKVRSAVLRFGLNYPVVSDPDYATWQRYNNNVWPRELIVDAKGVIRYDHRGEGAYSDKEAKIQELLTSVHPQAQFGQVVAPLRKTDAPGAVCYPTTPEIYLGHARGQAANSGGLQPDRSASYSITDTPPLHAWALQGQWLSGGEEIIQVDERSSPASAVMLHYEATEVFAVMRPVMRVAARLQVRQDGQSLTPANKGADIIMADGGSQVVVDSDRLYSLVQNRQHGEHVLQLTGLTGRVAIHTFTFGSSCM